MRFSICVIFAPASIMSPYADADDQGAYQVRPAPSPVERGLKMLEAPPAPQITGFDLETLELPVRTLKPTAPATRFGLLSSIRRCVTHMRLKTLSADFFAASATMGL